MLQYSIEILQKVSFNVYLFKRELIKALERLVNKELEILKRWVRIYSLKKPQLQKTVEKVLEQY